MTHSCNPQHFGRQRHEDDLKAGVWDQPGQHNETLSLQKLKKQISQTWWYAPVVPAPWGNQGERITWDQPEQHSKTLSTENRKISHAWWCMPVVPATWEAEVGGLLEPRRSRLQWAETDPLYSSLGNRASSCLKKGRSGIYKVLPGRKLKQSQGLLFLHFVFLFVCLFFEESCSCHPGWSTMALSRLTAISTSQVQGMLRPQSPQ